MRVRTSVPAEVWAKLQHARLPLAVGVTIFIIHRLRRRKHQLGHPDASQQQQSSSVTEGSEAEDGQRGYRDVKRGHWHRAGGRLERRLEYITPVKKNRLGPKEAWCYEQQVCRTRGAAGFVVTIEVHTPKVPYGGTFHCKLQWVAKRLSSSSTQLCVTAAVVFTKGCIVKAIIDRASMEGIRESYQLYQAHLSSHLPQLARHVRQCISSSDAPTASQTTQTRFRWTSALSKHHMIEEALGEVIQAASAPLRDAKQKADIAVVFTSGAHSALDVLGRITSHLREHLPSLKCIFGSTAQGVIDNNLPDADASPAEWQRLLDVPIDTNRHVNLVMASSPIFKGITDLLAGLDFAYPEAVKLGGLCSGSAQHLPRLGELGKPATAEPTWPAFCWNADPHARTPTSGIITDGCALLVLHGSIVIEPWISQGCRALTGQTWHITKLEGMKIQELVCVQSGRRRTFPPLRALQADLEAFITADNPPDKRKVAASILVGLACDDFKQDEDLGASDFVTRSLLGVSADGTGRGFLAVAGELRLGQRLRFLIRDQEGAMRDMEEHGLAHKRRALQATMDGQPEAPPFGALVFSCNGRGRRLYGDAHPHYDSTTLHSFVPVPSVGFFCNGEIGQVGKATFLHGFTCAAGILRQMPLDES
ncbi:hypothetical protein WJX73_003567 [Symbiochloris irregularis]|uniref:VASt domain-containing protein n=1 Tax=Symbiochloris irregularis TaxID=706552 RepID=A0AAW1NSB7_9CHLO